MQISRNTTHHIYISTHQTFGRILYLIPAILAIQNVQVMDSHGNNRTWQINEINRLITLLGSMDLCKLGSGLMGPLTLFIDPHTVVKKLILLVKELFLSY